VTFTGRFRADKAPDVLVEALALLDAPRLPTWSATARCAQR
jgi:hypothetical protein